MTDKFVIINGKVLEHPKFTGAQRYVREGLAKDGFFYEMKTEVCDGQIKGPIWDDSVVDTTKQGKHTLKHSYDEEFKSKEFVDAARFRDALISTYEWEEGYGTESFYYAFDNGFWVDEYKKHSKKIFDFIIQEEGSFGRCEGTHNFYEISLLEADGESDSHKSAGFALCESALYEIALMRYHISNCTGDQSDKLWRDKVFMILEDEVEKLPTKHNSVKQTAKKSQATKMKWLHAACVVLSTVDAWEDFIYNRLYDPDDFKYLIEISDRVSCAVKALISCETFNDQQMSKVLEFLTIKMESVAATFRCRISDDFWEGEKPALFGGSRANGALSTCQKLVKTYAEKSVSMASSPPSEIPSSELTTVHKNAPESNKRTPQESPVDSQSKKPKRS